MPTKSKGRANMSKDDPRAQVETDDLDDIIEIAERLRRADDERLSVEDVAEVGEALGIEAEYIQQARQQLVVQREQQARDARAAAARQKTLIFGGGIALIVVLAIGGLWSAMASSSLGNKESELNAKVRQVQSARERQKSVAKLLAKRPDSPDKDAELVGAENRVRVELKRCNEALAAYQRAANSFPASLWANGARFDKACGN